MIEAQNAVIRQHAESDLKYAKGLERHLVAGGTCGDGNIRDLLAMVKWNAELLIAHLDTSSPDRHPQGHDRNGHGERRRI